MSPNVVRVSRPLKLRRSTGSETMGVNEAQAASFQNSILRRGSRPAVEKVSSCVMLRPPVMASTGSDPPQDDHAVVSLPARPNAAHTVIYYNYLTLARR